MSTVHHALRRDVDLFSAAVRNTPAAERSTWALLDRRWELFAEMLREHQTVEAGDTDLLLDGCTAGFRRLAGHVDEDARAALTVRVCALRESLRRHLAHEAAGTVANVRSLPRPRLGKAVRVIPWAAYGVPREALDRVFSQPGGGRLWVIWRLTRRRFARRHARTFRFA